MTRQSCGGGSRIIRSSANRPAGAPRQSGRPLRGFQVIDTAPGELTEQERVNLLFALAMRQHQAK